jgi:hypothetical protein
MNNYTMKESNRITARGSDTTPAKMQAGFGRNDARRNAQRSTQRSTHDATRNATFNNAHPALRAPSPSERAGGEVSFGEGGGRGA